jgi:hypothetical protein
MKRALMVIAKRPAAGQTKTRLCPPLSAGQAVALYEAFLRDTLDVARAVPNVERFVLYLPVDEADYFLGLAPDFGLLPQEGDGLGERLDNALTHCLCNGYHQAVVMDSDSPTLPADYVAQAFTLLCGADAVFGPCDDGGYYLVGLNRPQPDLLRNVRMSTPAVLRDTLSLAERHRVRVALLPAWYDVDTASDLARLKDELTNVGDGVARYTQDLLRAR